MKVTLCMETVYGLCEKMDKDPDSTLMPNPRQREEALVDAFPKDFRLAYDLCRGEFTESFAEIGEIMEDHFDRESESSSSSSDSDSTVSSESSNGSTKTDSSNCRRKKKIAKSNKRKNKKSECSKKKGMKSKKTPTQAKPAKKHPGAKGVPYPWRTCLGRLSFEPEE